MSKSLYLIILFFILGQFVFAQSEARLIREGNKKYHEEEYQEAEIKYLKALEENPESVRALFNLGAALYQHDTLNTFELSERIFDTISQIAPDKMQKSSAYHNLGNSLLELKKYKESLEAYKQALRNNPNDFDSKYNLEYARQMLKQQQQKQQQNQDKNKGQQNKDQKKEQDKNKQDENKQDKKDENQDKQEQQQQQDKQEQEKEKQKKNQPNEQKKDNADQEKQKMPKPQQISKEDAKRLLEALKNEERKTLQKIMKQKAKDAASAKSEKDW